MIAFQVERVASLLFVEDASTHPLQEKREDERKSKKIKKMSHVKLVYI